jgi:hypothetical protein
MFVREEIDRAIDLHRRSYNLLKWLGAAIGKGFIQFNRAHEYMDIDAAAKEWIASHLLNLPPNCRPEHEDLDQFAKYFSTYLTTSFDLVAKPGTQLTSECGCYCSFCTYAVSAPNLKTRKVSKRDSERAQKLKAITLKKLAAEHQVLLTDDEVAKLIGSPETALDVSLITYSEQLLERTHGRSAGPLVLALWREIAWEKTAPKKNFELKADDILRAEESLTKIISE